MEFRVLGPLEVHEGDRELPVKGAKQRALLALLVLNANEVVSTDRLIEELWGESPPETAGTGLQGYVSHLRKALELERAEDGSHRLLLTRAPGYVLQLGAEDLDLRRFETLVAEGRQALSQGDPGRASALLEEGLALWRGAALADFAFQSWAQAEINRLNELRVAALEDRIEADLALGRAGEVVPELETLVSRHPLRERLCGQLMVALYRSGRQAEALEAYQAARRVLDEQLGLEPGPRLQELQRAILTQDPSLEPPQPPAPSRIRLTRVGRSRRALAAAGLVVAAGLAAATFLLVGGSGRAGVRVVANSVAVIDPRTEKVVADIPVGARPFAVAVGPQAVWVANREDQTLSRIDPRTRRVTATIGLGRDVTDVTVGVGSVWTANGNDASVSRIDPAFAAVAQTVQLSPASAVYPRPTQALTVGFGTVWAASGDSLERIEPVTGRVMARLHLWGPLSLAVGEGAVWVATTDEKIVKVQPESNAAAWATALSYIGGGVAVGSGSVWAISGPDTVWQIDPTTGKLSRTMTVGGTAGSITYGDRSVWVANDADGTISRIDPGSGKVRTIRVTGPNGPFVGHGKQTIAVGDGAVWVAVQARE